MPPPYRSSAALALGSTNLTVDGDNATIVNASGGPLDLIDHTSGGLSIGEMSGAGDIGLNGNTLTLGNLNTSGTIHDEDWYGDH